MLGELLRVLLLTTSILVVVIAFGAAIKPLANQSLLEASQTLKYMALAIVPMLQFALPFAAGFAGTMVFHRLTGDNEILAMRAAGIPPRAILFPILVLGLVLSLIMVLLTQAIIPRFWELMQRTVASDVTRVFEATIRSGRAFELGGTQIFADGVYVERGGGAEAPDTRLWLERVAAAELDDRDRMLTDVTAERAVVDLYRRDGRTFVTLAMFDAVGFNRATGELVSLPELRPDRPIHVTNAFDNDPKFMSRAELLRLRKDLDAGSTQVDRLRRDLAAALRTEALLEAVDTRLRSTGTVLLAVGDGTGTRYRLRAARLSGSRLRAGPDSPVVIERLGPDDGIERRFRPRRAELDHQSGVGTLLGDPALTLTLTDYDVLDAEGRRLNTRSALTLPNLRPRDVPLRSGTARSSEALLAEVAAMEQPSGQVRRLAQRLERTRVNLLREIEARLQKRYALSMTALLLLLLGVALAMVLVNSLPLTIYLWAFLPSIADLILISSGEQMLRDGEMAGYVVLWSGNAALVVGLLLTLRRLRRA